MIPVTVFDLVTALTAYAATDSSMAQTVERFVELAASPDDAYSRSNVFGHFTGSALVISADGRRTLLTHHRKLGLWLQPGGHADGDRDLRRVALREADEETGLCDLTIDADIFDLDRHWIPDRPGEPGHWHYDVRFVVHARGSERFVVTPESIDLRWWPLETVAEGDEFDPSLRRMAQRWRTRSGMG